MNQQSFHLKVGDGRRIVLPTEVCRRLSVGIGDEIVLRVEDDHATLSSVDQTIARFQAILAECVPPGVSMVDDLIHERREEAMRE